MGTKKGAWSGDGANYSDEYSVGAGKLLAQKYNVPYKVNDYDGAWGTAKHLWDGGSTSEMEQNGLRYNPDGTLSDMQISYAVVPAQAAEMLIPEGKTIDVANVVYRGLKKGLPYIGKAFNLLKRYTKAERALMQITPVLSKINDAKLLRAVEQRALEYQRTLGPVANKNNAFNPKRKDYDEYMKKADNWLNKNAPNWKDLFTK